MKYKYEPNCHIVDYEVGVTKFKFDEKGEFETEDSKLNDWIKKNKNFLKPIQEEKKKSEKQKSVTTVDSIKCKKCDFVANNKGDLLQHYKHEHPKK